MIYFFSDLDNTLVYSHRISLPGKYIVVEHLNECVQSHMTKKTFDFLSRCSQIQLIPTTMRTGEQYARLSGIFMKFRCRYALICNGGILLDNNKIDSLWTAETRQIAKDEIPALETAAAWIRGEFPEQSFHWVNGIMIYVRADNPEQMAYDLSRILDGTRLTVYYDSRKVYCVPSSVNKGAALKRFMAREGIDWSIAAGDGIPDIPMLEAANMAILPDRLSGMVENPQQCVLTGPQCFSDFICDELSGLLSFFAKTDT
ncbi:MAG: HAD hydrolase family protein [Lachnospiraceae bacterium]|nr:HAD hydrolase family protein [Lachnospiraceae bacterium]